MRLSLESVGHAFAGGTWLFRDLNAEFLPGNSYALTGPSGSGKSTLLSLIAGWASPREGNITVHEIRTTSWVFQNSHGIPRRTAVDHVALPLLAAGATRLDATREAHTLLERFSLSAVAHQEFRALSGGEAQRLMFARAVASQPQLLLVDEPTAQLDSVTTRIVNDVVSELSGIGRIVLVATHDPCTMRACDMQIDLEAFAAA